MRQIETANEPYAELCAIIIMHDPHFFNKLETPRTLIWFSAGATSAVAAALAWLGFLFSNGTACSTQPTEQNTCITWVRVASVEEALALGPDAYGPSR